MFVPANFQVAFVNFIAIFWSAYMSYMKNHKVDPDTGKVVQPRVDQEEDIIKDCDQTEST